MESIKTTDAFNLIKDKSNRYLCNFLLQRRERLNNPEGLLKLVIGEVNNRREKELAYVWRGVALNDEPIERILEELKLVK
jgi:F0F1-type ATP synthase delta subunit